MIGILVIVPPTLHAQSPTTSSTTLPASSAERWAFDAPRSYGRDIGSIRGLATAVDDRGYAHSVYQTSVDFMGSRNSGALIVQGVTPSGDRYERRLWTGDTGVAVNNIAVDHGRVLIVAGVDEGDVHVRVWWSEDGGATWDQPQQPFERAYGAVAGILPDGRGIVAVGIREDSRFSTAIAIETVVGSHQWTTTQPFAWGPVAKIAVWIRDSSIKAHANLPVVAVASGRSGGVDILTSYDAATWQSSRISSDTPHTMRLSAVNGTLVLMHEMYGRRTFWLAQSNPSVSVWQSVQVDLPPNLVVMANPLLDDSRSDDVNLVTSCFFTDRAFGTHRTQICVFRVPREHILAAERWQEQAVKPWTPLAMSSPHNGQTLAFVAPRGVQAMIVWIGQFAPSDFLHINATQAGFVLRSEAMYTTIRIAALAHVPLPTQ